MQSKKTLLALLVDGLSIVRRVYEAIPGDDSPERATGAVKSSLSSFGKILARHEPTHALLAFDAEGPTWRHELFPDYRATRAPMPPPLREALPSLYEKLEQMGLTTISQEGVEAEDTLATAFYSWNKSFQHAPAVVVSSDKDLMQLVGHGALFWDHFRNCWIDTAWIEKRFGVKPEQMHDFLALLGDQTDGVPGVPRIGKATAARLLREYHSLDAVLDAAEQIGGKQGESLRHNYGIARLSRALVSFKTDKPIQRTWADFRVTPYRPSP